jgi:hypothetical protein
MKYKEGDVVAHKSKPYADVKMLIISVEDESDLFGPRYWCRWFDSHNHLCKDSFKEFEIELLNL